MWSNITWNENWIWYRGLILYILINIPINFSSKCAVFSWNFILLKSLWWIGLWSKIYAKLIFPISDQFLFKLNYIYLSIFPFKSKELNKIYPIYLAANWFSFRFILIHLIEEYMQCPSLHSEDLRKELDQIILKNIYFENHFEICFNIWECKSEPFMTHELFIAWRKKMKFEMFQLPKILCDKPNPQKWLFWK
jgi:hypothetical protein